MNNEEGGYERFRAHMRMTGKIALMLIVTYTGLREYEKDPRKPFSGAFANAALGYALNQLAHIHVHVFRLAEYPRFVLFDIISIFCLHASIIIAFAAIFFN